METSRLLFGDGSMLSYLHLNSSHINLNFLPKNGSILSSLYQNRPYTQFLDQENLILIESIATGFLNSLTYSQFIGILFCAGIFFSQILSKRPKVVNAPYHGYRSRFEPTFFVQSRYVLNAKNIIASGYKKYKDTPFVIRRYDTDISVLPKKYLDEIRLYPVAKLSGVKAQNLVNKYTYTTLMIESNLHFRVLQNKLTPNLTTYLDIAKEELEYGWPIDVAQPEEWTEVDIQDMMRMLVARMSAKIFLGYPACRDEEWLRTSIDFSINMFATAFMLRMFPPWMHPVVAHLVPTRYRLKKNLRTARKIIGPLMEKHQKALASKGTDDEIEEDDTLLNWMMDNGNEKENKLPEMAARQSVLTLASIHTTSMGIANMLFDLCAHPKWFEPLRQEVIEVLAETKGQMKAKEWLPRLEKMDSFFVESQRFNPPILLAPQRLAVVDITLKDGTRIPKGTRLACANSEILNDPSVTPNPEAFDPMRSYRKRHETGELNKHLAGQPDKDNLSFGHGKQACPGRYFAVGEIKMILARLLLEFEFKYPEGKSRPKNFYADENVFPDPRARLMMRKRR
ncbi:putative cytochrome P450 [Delitschia confertaspora ATCC 74209]|uniref:Cytochrome P450 n=1 Tax=Delitschia confertaspora ATCC 74209 TaxID=1513339 RepID=A0A9P4JG54_9PLEO|nr:putative cytochrome P450 [Delitschia confertaspora ATCC 74209]